MFLFQLTALPNLSDSVTVGGLGNYNVLFLLIGVLVLISGTVGLIFILKAILHSTTRSEQGANMVVLQILVPKEKSSETGTGTEDRLEQIKEEIGVTETLFSAIAGTKNKRSAFTWFTGLKQTLSFEIVVHESLISFYVVAPKKKKDFIEQQIHAQYPDAQIDEMADYNIFSEKSTIVGAYMKTKEPNSFPIKTYKNMDSDPLSAPLNTLAKIQDSNSSAAIQFIIHPSHNAWRKAGRDLVRDVKKGKKIEKVIGTSFSSKIINLFKEFFKHTAGDKDATKSENYQLSQKEEEMIRGIEEKISKGGLEITTRILSISDDEESAKQNLDNLINSFGQYNMYQFGANFSAIKPRNQSKIIRDFIYRSFHDKYHFIFNTEELSSVWHPPLHSTDAPNIKWLSARKAPPPPNIPKEGLLLGHTLYRGQDVKIRMADSDRRRHLYVIGKSGGGKSVFISGLAIQDIQAGKGVCVVDPHGDLVEHILEHIPKERAEDVIIFNPSDLEYPIGLNMLDAKTEDQKDFAVQEMISIFYKLFPPEMIGPMFEHNMRNVMLTLMADIENPGTIIDIPRMFTDDDYVKQYLDKLTDPVVRAFWEKEMAKTSDFHKSEMLGYLISKVGRFVENTMMRNIMGQQKSGLDFREIMDKKKILLVNLAKGKTGEINAKLLGLIIVAKLQMAAFGRADLPEEERHDFYLYIDEFQNFITDSIATILSEARKYRLNLIIAHQYMGQLIDDKGSTAIRDAVLGNAGSICSFRIGPDDAETLAKEFAPVFGAYDLINVEQFTTYIKLLIDNAATKPFNMKTYPPVSGNKKLAVAIKELARLKYGRNREFVEYELMDRTKIGEVPVQAKKQDT
ncbi:MAG: type IV secretion system DNA-binding domain-containing protein [Candidatus Magasanikbacteria bacterium]|nr:type IV secretion system DNA-binding domain-containing protein [Candidatus Magasanikbacteria bacterium]